jgi:hypothetical protein
LSATRGQRVARHQLSETETLEAEIIADNVPDVAWSGAAVVARAIAGAPWKSL